MSDEGFFVHRQHVRIETDRELPDSGSLNGCEISTFLRRGPMQVALYAVASLLLLLVGFYVTVSNAVVLAGSKFLRPMGSQISPIPLLGGLISGVGLCLIPLKGVSRWFWVPLIAEVAAIPILASVIAYYALRRRDTPKSDQ